MVNQWLLTGVDLLGALCPPRDLHVRLDVGGKDEAAHDGRVTTYDPLVVQLHVVVPVLVHQH